MTQLHAEGVSLEFHQGDRMRKALEHADMTPGDMADYLEVSGHTITRWTKNKGPVKRSILMLWAMRTGVSTEWLETGKAPAGEPDRGLEYASTDLNREPADYVHPCSDLGLSA